MSLPDGMTVHLPLKGPAEVLSRTGNVLLVIKPASAEGRAEYVSLLIDIFDEVIIDGYGVRAKF